MTIQEADQLIRQYVELRDQARKSSTPALLRKLKKSQALCIEKFSYLVAMKTARYKNFNNYEDLNQEALEALVKAMNSYNPNKGNVFWWFHHYLDTRIARSANTHTTIKYPLKYAKEFTPFREPCLPLLVDSDPLANDLLEKKQTFKVLKDGLFSLNGGQQKVLTMLCGMDGEEPQSVSKICQKLKMSRESCLHTIEQACSILRDRVKL